MESKAIWVQRVMGRRAVIAGIMLLLAGIGIGALVLGNTTPGLAQASACAGGAINDDGSRDGSQGPDIGGGVAGTSQIVGQFNFPETPFEVEDLCICLMHGDDANAGSTFDLSFNLMILEDNAGTPGAVLHSVPMTVTGIPHESLPATFFNLPLDLDVTQLDVFVGIRWDATTYPSRYICRDSSQPGRSIATLTNNLTTSAGTYAGQVMVRFGKPAPPPVPGAPAATLPPAPGLIVPNVGMVRVDASDPVPAFASPGGEIITDGSGRPILLPNDADGNGFDTYVVTEVQQAADETWVGVFLGAQVWAWLPLADVTPMTSLP